MRSKLNKLKPVLVDILSMELDASDNFNINGIVVSSMKGKSQVMILSQFVTATGHKLSINTHNIPFDENDYKEQSNIEKHVNDIVKEVYEYLFGRKQAQLDLVDESEKLEN